MSTQLSLGLVDQHLRAKRIYFAKVLLNECRTARRDINTRLNQNYYWATFNKAQAARLRAMGQS